MLGLKINTFEPKSGAPDEASAVVAAAPDVTIEAPSTMAPVTRIECTRESNVRMLISSSPDLSNPPQLRWAPLSRTPALAHRTTTSLLNLRSREDRPARRV